MIERGVTAHGFASIPYSRWMSTVARTVKHGEVERELGAQLVVPLKLKRRRADDHDAPDASPGEQLSQHQTRFDRLAKSDVVSEQQRYARHLQAPSGPDTADTAQARQRSPTGRQARARRPVRPGSRATDDHRNASQNAAKRSGGSGSSPSATRGSPPA